MARSIGRFGDGVAETAKISLRVLSGELQGQVIRVDGAVVVGRSTTCQVFVPDRRISREHAKFKQTDADVASFDGGFGSAYLARQVGQKFAREIFFLGRK